MKKNVILKHHVHRRWKEYKIKVKKIMSYNSNSSIYWSEPDNGYEKYIYLLSINNSYFCGANK